MDVEINVSTAYGLSKKLGNTPLKAENNGFSVPPPQFITNDIRQYTLDTFCPYLNIS